MASRRPGSDAQIAELYELYLAEKGLRGEPPDPDRPLRNGTGKTGYARVLKRMAAVRDPEEIVPNIRDNQGAAATAQIAFRLGDAEGSLTWRNEVGVSPFTRMSIFDSPAVNVRVDENLTYVYTRAEISLFDYVNAGIRALQELGALRRRQPRNCHRHRLT